MYQLANFSVMVVYLKRLINLVPATRENGACQSDGLNCLDLSHAADVSGWGREVLRMFVKFDNICGLMSEKEDLAGEPPGLASGAVTSRQ